MKPFLPLLVVLASLAPAASGRPPPNILFIMADDHAYQAVSAYGEERRLIQTPNLDRIASEGIRFDRCVVTNSLCGPSRATILTGKYSHLNGFYDNHAGATFDGAQVTFPKLLRQAGYQTAMIGKWHLASDPTGFDFWQILIGQGIYYNAPMIRNGQPLATHGYVTDVITAATLDWLKQRDRTRPFLLMMQHKAPHRAWEPALRDLNFDGDRRYPEPPTLFDDYSGRGIAEHDQDMTIAHTLGTNPDDLKLSPPRDLDPEQAKVWSAYYRPRNDAMLAAHLEGRALTSWKYQRYLHDYLACVHGIDESVGAVLAYLDEQGLADNTLVVYTSDQGFFLGEHGWFDKRWIFEESLRAPLLVRWPGVIRPGSVNRDLVSNLDFAETFLDAAGVAVPAEMQGRSLRPIFQGPTPADWRTAFYYQYYEYPQPHHVRPHYGVVTDRYKLVQFYGTGEDYTELFDLGRDPHELHSFFGDPRYAATQARLAKELAALRVELKVPPGPVRTDPLEVLRAMERAADWQQNHPSPHPATDWTQAAWYAGELALAEIAPDARYFDRMRAVGQSTHWKLGPRPYHADDQAVGQAYLELYRRDGDKEMIADLRARADRILASPPPVNLDFATPGASDSWSWCDSLFMAPPGWIQLSVATGDPRYEKYAVAGWWRTSQALYDPAEHLFFRDSRFVAKRDAQGRKIFWSRGNGWVLAALARILESLPPGDPARPRFERQFVDLAVRVAGCQQPDGLWRVNLLDPSGYPLPETSGSAFFCYGLAWGISHRLLDSATYEPVVRRAWIALLGCLDQPGRLSHVQPIGADPRHFAPDATECYGVGAFLLAGSAVYRCSLRSP